MRRRPILTKNAEIFSKMKMLDIVPEVVISGVNGSHLRRIVNNANKKNRVLELTQYGKDVFHIKRVGMLDFNIYLNKK